MNKVIQINGNDTTIEQVWEVMHDPNIQVEISAEAKEAIKRSRKRVEAILEKGEVVYGINTGFGSLANQVVSSEDLDLLQENLIRSHCVGVNQPFGDAIVRGILFLRANTLCKGFSGVRLYLVESLLKLLNHNVVPIIPSTGSLGASGDLAPLAHMSLALLGEGEVRYKGKQRQAREVLDEIGLLPVRLKAKEGLALINGTPVMCALGVECLVRAKNLLKAGDIIATMSLEALAGTDSAFHPSLHELRPHPGQKACAANLYRLLDGSQNKEAHVDCTKVQDAYSLRCVPQVHGAAYDSMNTAWNTIAIEINSVTDNPLVFEDRCVSGGNFHGEPIAMVLGYLSMGICELGSISERRQNRLMNHDLSSLPPFLVENPGLNSGLMIAQYTSAACISENKSLAYPAVLDSVPTSADQEDHVSMGVTAAKNCLTMVINLENIFAIEYMIAGQGLDLGMQAPCSAGITGAHKLLREHVEVLKNDRVLRHDILAAAKLIGNGTLVETVEKITGELNS